MMVVLVTSETCRNMEYFRIIKRMVRNVRNLQTKESIGFTFCVLQQFCNCRNVRFMTGDIEDVSLMWYFACLFNNAVGHQQ